MPAQPTGRSSGASEAPDGVCPNCGQPGLAAYCSRCGEKRRDRADYQLSSIAGEAFSEIANLEHSKLWQTLRLLLLKPGQLTRYHWEGVRQRFLGPLKLYFVFFAVSLVLYSVHQPTAVYDIRTLAASEASGRLTRAIEERANRNGTSTAQFTEAVNTRWQAYLSASQIVYPLVVALSLKLLYRRRGMYFAEHLVFAFHLLAFLLLSWCLAWPLYLVVGGNETISHFSTGYVLLTLGALAWMALYLVYAVRRAYRDRWLFSIAKAAVVFVTYLSASFLVMVAALMLAISRTADAL